MKCNYIEDLERSSISEIHNYGNNNILPKASVVIVTYNTDKDLLSQNLKSLKEQTIKDFEILVVDNSDKVNLREIVSKYNLKYLRLEKNYGPMLARNVGIKYSNGDIIIFLDDDAIPAGNFVEQHIRAYDENNILGLRGKVLPRTYSIYNYFASHYDLGNQPITCPINIEGNSSFKRTVLFEVGGFNPKLLKVLGHEGIELTYRIICKYKDKSKLIYWPCATIYHNYANTFIKYLRKSLRHAGNADMLKTQYPGIFKFFQQYNLNPNNKKNKTLNLIDKIRLKVIIGFVLLILRTRNLIYKYNK
ncbi:MAG: glycosyltransferase family 2 protein [Candidatus Methanoperedens sp.]|nr:glycosyltransferase family 2 protein [Candidatus Methanoperedens sp.]